MNKRILPILQRLGLRRPVREKRFAQKFINQFGDLGSLVIEAMGQRYEGVFSSDFWSLKNQNPDLSLALSSQILTNFYQEYLLWIDNVPEPFDPVRILDIGCDNGILTCAYALKFPTATVIGIDKNPEAISCAKSLAKRQKIENVDFQIADILGGLHGLNSTTPFDLITGIMAYNSVIEIPSMPKGWSLSELELPDSSIWKQLLQDTGRLLASHGHFISVERLISSASIHWWAKALDAVGLHINWPSSMILTYSDFEESYRHPAFLSGHQYESGVSVYDTLAFDGSPELLKFADKQFKGVVAEALFRAFASRSLIYGCEFRHVDGVHERIEIWDANTVILCYTYSSRSTRNLVIGPRHRYQECMEYVRGLLANMTVDNLKEYRSLTERDMSR